MLLKGPLKKLFILQKHSATHYTDRTPTVFILICSTQLVCMPTSTKRSYYLCSSVVMNIYLHDEHSPLKHSSAYKCCWPLAM